MVARSPQRREKSVLDSFQTSGKEELRRAISQSYRRRSKRDLAALQHFGAQIWARVRSEARYSSISSWLHPRVPSGISAIGLQALPQHLSGCTRFMSFAPLRTTNR